MRGLKLCTAVGLMLAVSGTAQGLTFTFDPNDLIDLYPAGPGPQATQANARKVWYTDTGWSGSTFGDQNDYDSYIGWLDDLSGTPGGHQEGISSFYVWLLDYRVSSHTAWGNQLVWNPDDPTPTATSDPGDYEWAGTGMWHDVNVFTYDFGWCLQWCPVATAYNIGPGGVDLPEFSFTSKPYWDLTGNGWTSDDVLVQEGDTMRVLFESNALNCDGQVPHGSAMWRGTLGENYIIPEPFSVATLFMAVGGLGMYYRRKRRMG